MENGVPFDVLHELSSLYNCSIKEDGFQRILKQNKRRRSISQSTAKGWSRFSLDDIALELTNRGVALTDRENVYQYYKRDNVYIYDKLNTEILSIISSGKAVSTAEVNNDDIGIVLKESNFYTEAGGQMGDEGIIEFLNCSNGQNDQLNNNKLVFKVADVEEIDGYIIHWGSFILDARLTGNENVDSSNAKTSQKRTVRVGDAAVCSIDSSRRFGCTQHHTASHLLHRACIVIAGLYTNKCNEWLDQFKLLLRKVYECYENGINNN